MNLCLKQMGVAATKSKGNISVYLVTRPEPRPGSPLRQTWELWHHRTNTMFPTVAKGL